MWQHVFTSLRGGRICHVRCKQFFGNIANVGVKSLCLSSLNRTVSNDADTPATGNKSAFSYTSIEDHLFDKLSSKEHGKISVPRFVRDLRESGILVSDPRLSKFAGRMRALGATVSKQEDTEGLLLDRQQFTELISDNLDLIWRAFTSDFVIPDFQKMAKKIDQMYYSCGPYTDGKVADYIPQLSRFSPDFWGISVCTVDGQRHSIGDTTIPFCLQSCSKPLTYALALNELGPEVVHQYVGQEPSGRGFNEIKLDARNKPHNPMINAGAILVAALTKNNAKLADRFDFNGFFPDIALNKSHLRYSVDTVKPVYNDQVSRQYSKMTGGEFLGFNNAVYLSERETADRNFALAYYMRENQCFPEGVNLNESLELYFQMCSVEVTCQSASVIAATLANGGICPTSMEKVVDVDAVRNTLSLMYSCGMYDYSGQFAFQVGLPAKSGVSGAILLVVPNVMGLCMWSPPLDELGNSVRGLAFCQRFVDVYNFHNYDNIRHITTPSKHAEQKDQDMVEIFNFHNYDSLKHTLKKEDPRRMKSDVQSHQIMSLLFGAYNGDLSLLRREALRGTDMGQADYDGRTVLHIAAAEGHMECVCFLVDKCNLDIHLKDRWGQSALADAERFGHTEIVELLKSAGATSS